MISEGVGHRPPVAVQRRITLAEQLQILDIAKQRADYRCYQTRQDLWGNGCKDAVVIQGLGEVSRAVRPIYAGLLGENCVKEYLDARFTDAKIRLDTDLRAQGDFGVDLSAFGMKMQIKTRQNERKENLVRRCNERGYFPVVNAHAFIFCEWNQSTVVYLVGWCWAELVTSKPLVESSIGAWKNAVVYDHELLPMSSLRDELSAWRAARCL